MSVHSEPILFRDETQVHPLVDKWCNSSNIGAFHSTDAEGNVVEYRYA